MKVKIIKVGLLQTNCYILILDSKTIIIDPGDDYDKIENAIKGLTIEAILITHNHFDHIGALSNFKNIKIYDKSVLEEKKYNIGNFEFNVIYTPGHTDDSITYYFEKEKMMFVGDFIFENSIGRTDLETGDIRKMQKSINKIKKYKENIIIYPGHGNSTTLKKELKNNYYFE